MILNARNNSFAFFFPPDFFADEIKEKYRKYYQSLILPYDTIDDFMSSTVQQIDFPGWSMEPAQQVRTLGKRQEYKNSTPIEDLFKREFTVTFKMTDAFMNYWIFLDNALNFLDFDNREKTMSPMRLSFLNNEGYLVTSVIFKNPILKGQEGIKLSYSSVTPEFRTFTATFQYFYFDIEIDFD
jgi:hypothetical protein